MDGYLLKKYCNEFVNQKLKIDPFMKHRLGLNQKKSFIKTDQYCIYCAPIELSFTGCTVLVVLKKHELAVLSDDNKLQKRIHFSFKENQYLPVNKAAFYIKIDDFEAVQMDISLDAWIIDLSFSCPPEIYNEILINIFLDKKKFFVIYNNKSLCKHYIDRTRLKDIGIKDHAMVNQESIPLVKMSFSKIFLLIDNTGYLQSPDVHIEIFSEDQSFFIDGVYTRNHQLPELPGYEIAEVNIEYSLYLVEILYSFICNNIGSADTAVAR